MQSRIYFIVAGALSLAYTLATVSMHNTDAQSTDAIATGASIDTVEASRVTLRTAAGTGTAINGVTGARTTPGNHEPAAGETDATPEQQSLYKELQAIVGNPQFLQTYKLSELVRQTHQLTPRQRDNLTAQVEQMLARGEITLQSFKPESFPRHRLIGEGATLPTREQTSYYEELMTRMSDPGYLAGLSFDLLVQQAKPLPPALKQALADSVADNIRLGLIDAGKLLGPEYAGVRDVQLYLN